MPILFAVILMLLCVPAEAKPLNIVASFSVLGDLAKQIGGENVTVTTLVGADGDAHTYQPTPADAKNLVRAQMVVVNGLGMEGWMDKLISASGSRAVIVVASRNIAKPLKFEENGEISPDPHAWQNIANGITYVNNIAEAMAENDPPHAAIYQARAKELSAEFAKLDAWVRTQIATVPAEKRAVISSHDAFGYFADAYGVKFMAPVGLSTEDEPSAQELKKLVETIRSGKTRTLFLENMADAKVITQLAREAGVVVGGKLYADALSPPNGAAGNYQQMFRYNVTQLVAAMKKNQ